MATETAVGSAMRNDSRIPRVSIGMPVYNGEEFLPRALGALLEQTFTDFELIISDNASTDATGDICQEYAKQDPRIRYYRQRSNGGPTANFQFVLDHALADYFMWAAVDDNWSRHCLHVWVKLLDMDESIAIVFSNYKVFCHVDTEIEEIQYIDSSVGDTKKKRLLSRMLNPTPSLIYGLFRTRYAKELKVQRFDYFDVYFGNYMAIRGKVVIAPNFLYSAGIKARQRQPYSLSGGKIRVMPFFSAMRKLIARHFSLPDRMLFHLILTLQCWSFHKRSCR